MADTLTLIQFANQFYPYFQVDEHVHTILMKMHLLAIRHPALEKEKYATPISGYQERLSLNKGIMVIGSVGVGKSDLMRIYQSYLRYLDSPYQFNSHITWKVAKEYEKKGSESLTLLDSNNLFFDELCLLDEDSGVPEMEWVNYYGNKKLIGKVIAIERYEVYKDKGLITHFATNCSMQQLEEIYKERSISRLAEMCNILIYVGKDRRKMNSNPVIFRNVNSPVNDKKIQPVAPEIHKEENDESIKLELEEKYVKYLSGNGDVVINWLDYQFLSSFGCEVMTPERVEKELVPRMMKVRQNQVNATKSAVSMEEGKRLIELRKQYIAGQIDDAEKLVITRMAYREAVLDYFYKRQAKFESKLFD